MASHLMWLDLVILFTTSFLSIGIGLYQARAKQQTTNDYLMGGRELKVVPVAISMMATFTSVVTILGNASELHYFGTTYMFLSLGKVLAHVVVALVIVPVIYPLKLTSINQVGWMLCSVNLPSLKKRQPK